MGTKIKICRAQHLLLVVTLCHRRQHSAKIRCTSMHFYSSVIYLSSHGQVVIGIFQHEYNLQQNIDLSDIHFLHTKWYFAGTQPG